MPLGLFIHKTTREPLKDQAVIDRLSENGMDVWRRCVADLAVPRTFPRQQLAEEWEQVTDVVDVWFDSGSTHAFSLEQGVPTLNGRAASMGGQYKVMYLEGSDQHRGWFHSSLLESCGTRGHAPYDVVLTHGFVLDEKGRKMSKSLGNVVAPQDVMAQSGADILRLWVVASDYAHDLSIGPNILKQMSDLYRRLRNTLRYLLGNLAGFSESERVDAADMPELERFILHRMTELDHMIRDACDKYDFASVAVLTQFMNSRRAVGVLFRYPQGCAVLRRAIDRKRRAWR